MFVGKRILLLSLLLSFPYIAIYCRISEFWKLWRYIFNKIQDELSSHLHYLYVDIQPTATLIVYLFMYT